MEPRLIPPDKETAYRVARMVEEEIGWEVAGWKIAGAKADMQKALRTDSPIYGRVYAPLVKQSPVTLEHSRQCSPIPEDEYEAVLSADLPPRKNLYSIDPRIRRTNHLCCRNSKLPGLEIRLRFRRPAAPTPSHRGQQAGISCAWSRPTTRTDRCQRRSRVQ
jgi:2-keto-4-pentenoate hydratase